MASDRSTLQLLAECNFAPPGSGVVCAVSGGADSLAMLALASAAGCVPLAMHVDHRLRPSSGDDFAYVHKAAEQLGVEAKSVSVDVGDGPNLEARARTARHAALPPGTLFAHTADDRAETMLVNLLRGAGVDGLGVLDPDTHPILGLRRADTEWVCEEFGFAYVHDITNMDTRFVRNRIRHEVLPLLRDVAGRDVVDLLARTAALARVDTTFLNDAAAALEVSDAKALAVAPPALARRAVRQWCIVQQDHNERYAPDLATVERVLAVARGEASGTDVGGGARVERTQQRLRWIAPQSSEGGGSRV